ncbi:MAG: DUF362 domain-containing protein [Fimbriimonadaceae bacterium]|nr:DUF362 domain-containing protein [Fimbriimonadaceae bacterium]
MAEPTDRRTFVGASAALAAGLLTRRASAQAPRAKVVVVRCPRAIDEQDSADAGAVQAMLERGVTALAGASTAAAAWPALVRSTDRVALVDAGTWLYNVPAVYAAVAAGLLAAKPARLSLAVCRLTNNNAAYMALLRAALEARQVPLELLDTGLYTLPCKFGDAGFTLLAAVPTLKAHPIAGVSGAVKHYATLTAGRIADYHPNGMETCGEVLAKEFGGHRHLTIIDGLRWGNARKGPSFYRKVLLLSTDPVAADAVALKLFLENGAPLNNIPPERHIQLADTKYQAGCADLDRIEVVTHEV